MNAKFDLIITYLVTKENLKEAYVKMIADGLYCIVIYNKGFSYLIKTNNGYYWCNSVTNDEGQYECAFNTSESAMSYLSKVQKIFNPPVQLSQIKNNQHFMLPESERIYVKRSLTTSLRLFEQIYAYSPLNDLNEICVIDKDVKIVPI